MRVPLQTFGRLNTSGSQISASSLKSVDNITTRSKWFLHTLPSLRRPLEDLRKRQGSKPPKRWASSIQVGQFSQAIYPQWDLTTNTYISQTTRSAATVSFSWPVTSDSFNPKSSIALIGSIPPMATSRRKWTLSSKRRVYKALMK